MHVCPDFSPKLRRSRVACIILFGEAQSCRSSRQAPHNRVQHSIGRLFCGTKIRKVSTSRHLQIEHGFVSRQYPSANQINPCFYSADMVAPRPFLTARMHFVAFVRPPSFPSRGSAGVTRVSVGAGKANSPAAAEQGLPEGRLSIVYRRLSSSNYVPLAGTQFDQATLHATSRWRDYRCVVCRVF